MADFKLNYTGAQINTILGNANNWYTSGVTLVANNAIFDQRIKLSNGITTLQILTFNNGPSNVNLGRLGLAETYSNLDLTKYRFHCMGDAMFTGQINNNLVAGGTFIAGTHEGSFNARSASTAGANQWFQAWYTGKTPSGAWGIGFLTNYNDLYFAYGTDANYNSGNNTTVNCRITTAGAFTNASKRELKENIKPINYSCLDIINKTAICSFNMKADENKDYRVGFIADDTDPIISGKNQDCMDLQNCVGVLIKAVQELSNKIDNLEKKVGDING